MGRWVALLLTSAVGCTSVHNIPAPDPRPSTGAPAQALAHYTRGMIQVSSGDLDGARITLEKARVFDPDSARILMALARVEMTAGDIGKARRLYEAAASTSVGEPSAWLASGRIELAFGDPATGRAALVRAEQLGDPWEARAALIADAIRNSQPPEGLQEWSERAVDEAVELRRRADLRFMAGDPAGALGDYAAVLALRSSDLSLVSPIVAAASQGMGVAQGVVAAEAIVHQRPNATAAWLVLGVLSGLMEDHQMVVDALDRAEALGVGLGPGTKQAREAAKAAIERGSAGPPMLRTPPLGDPVNRAIRAVEDSDWSEAERALETGLSHSPDDVRLLFIRSQLVLKRDGAALAMPYVERVLERNPGFGPALNLWAWIQAETDGDLKRAEQMVREALEHHPRVGAYWDTLGWLLYLQGRDALAVRSLSRALRLSPKDDTIRAHLEQCKKGERR